MVSKIHSSSTKPLAIIVFVLVFWNTFFQSSHVFGQSCSAGTVPINGPDTSTFNFTSNNQCLEITNTGSITVGDSTTAIQNGSPGFTNIGITNNGEIIIGIASSYGIANDGGSITNLTNNGIIRIQSGITGLGYGILNNSNIGTINNAGTINTPGGYGINTNGGVITNLINSGTISATQNLGSGIQINSGRVENLTNTGTIRGYRGISNAATISVLINSGSSAAIRGFGPGGTVAFENTTTGVVTNFINSGVVEGNSHGLTNASGGTITTIVNQSGGYFGGGGSGIWNAGSVNTISNYGALLSTFGNGLNNTGVIATFNNAQGGSASSRETTALTYDGNLPTNYNIIINSPTHYGQLSVRSPSGSTTFGIFSGSVIAKGTYSSVLSGISSSNLNNNSGSINGFRWSLVNSSSNVWDLVIVGASTADTQQSLINTASVLQGTFTLQNSVMVNGFTYDCSLFDKHGVCVSAGGRNTTVQAQGINNTSGLLIASYRLNKNNTRIGAWVDQNLSVSGPSTVQLGNSTPMIGLFGVWSQRPDGVGAEVKVSAAYGQKDTTITRQIVGTSEAGTGGSQLISQGAQVVAKYGFAVLSDVVVSPYAGVRYTQNNMGGYTEATSSAVTAPLTYSALNTNATTALAGAEARYRGIPKTTLFASAGVETDTNTSNGSYSATGVDGLTPVNFNPNPVKTRPTATVGGYYDILKNQRIGVTGIYRQEPFQAVSTTTVLATYTIGL